MKQPIVITTAITGSQPRKKDNPALPVTPAEQIESTHEAFEAGSSLVHIHVRDKDENSSSDPELFAQVQEGVRKHCPGMIIQFSTGGRGREADTVHQEVDNQTQADGEGQKLQRREDALHQCPDRCVASRALRRGIQRLLLPMVDRRIHAHINLQP